MTDRATSISDERNEDFLFMKTPHPTARALFTAFHTTTTTTTATTTTTTNKRQSEFIRKKSLTLGWRSRHSQAELYPFTVHGISSSIQQVQRGEVEETYGTGATVWPASIVLCKYMELYHNDLLHEKTVIDLGAGTGITSVTAAMLGAASVTCTDGCDKVVELAKKNVERVRRDNSARKVLAPINVCKYSWGDGSIQTTYDVILVADCVLPKLYPMAPLVAAIDDLLSCDGVAILSYEHRYYSGYDPRAHFVTLATARNLLLEKIPIQEQDPVYSVDDIEIWKVSRAVMSRDSSTDCIVP